MNSPVSNLMEFIYREFNINNVPTWIYGSVTDYIYDKIKVL